MGLSSIKYTVQKGNVRTKKLRVN